MKRSFIILLHIGYWLLYLLLLSLIFLLIEAGNGRIASPDYQRVIGFIRIMGALTIIPAVTSFYTFYGLLFNRYLSNKKFTRVFAGAFVIIIVAGFAGFAGLHFVTNGKMVANNGLKEMSIIVFFMSLLALIHGIIALVIKGFISWYNDIRIKQVLKQKNFETELALVKAQLNPHFLFNTINNIDVLILKDPEKASAYLNKLSDIIRFILYETKTESIPLKKELEYIDKYIQLQKIRSANQNYIRYTLEGDAGNWKIAPMLFIPFIENAFKHSVNKKEDDSIKVNISISDKLEFYCENGYAENSSSENEAGGLGSELIQKRLTLLYPLQHELKTESTNNIYKVYLTIYNEDQLHRNRR